MFNLLKENTSTQYLSLPKPASVIFLNQYLVSTLICWAFGGAFIPRDPNTGRGLARGPTWLSCGSPASPAAGSTLTSKQSL